MPGHTLVLLRHAKSDWSTEDDDLDRPLARRGRRQAPETGRWLAAHGPTLDRAVVSPAVRAVRTWDRVCAQLPEKPPTFVDERVYAAPVDELLAVLAELPEDVATALLVGHNPGLEDLLERLTGEAVRMPTAALALVEVPSPWSGIADASCTLRGAGRPPA